MGHYHCVGCRFARPTYILGLKVNSLRVLFSLSCRRKKARLFRVGLSCIWSLAMSYFHIANATLSSALFRFTTEFGMGSGGSKTLWLPSKLGCQSVFTYQLNLETLIIFFKSKYLSTLAINFCRLFLSQNAFGVVWLSLTGN